MERQSTDRIEDLVEKHNDIERRLAKLDGRLHLGVEDQMERKRLQKMKLQMKDEIARLET